MMLSVVIPARNEAETIEKTLLEITSNLDRKGIDYEVIVVDDASSDRTAAAVERVGAANPRVRCLRSHFSNGFGFAVRAGLDAFEGDAVAIVMADGSDDPSDLVLYHELLEEGYDCAFGSRFMPGATITDYPRAQARDQPGRELGHPGPVPPPLQRHHQRLQGLPRAKSSRVCSRCSRTTSTSPWSCR